MKILILALSGIGDALMFTPALSVLKKQLPEAQIDALVMFKGVRDMYSRNPNLSNVLFYDFMKEGTFKSLQYLLKLRKTKYEITINVYPSNRKEYNIFSFLTGAETRVGVKYLRSGKSNFDFLNNVTITENDNLHNVQENVHLVETITDSVVSEIPGLEFHLLEEDLRYAESYLERNNINSEELVIGFHPGCATLKNHIKRRWEPDKFSQLAVQLIEKYNAKILLFGGPEELELKETIAKGISSDRKLVIETDNLAQSVAVMKRCNLFITNDSSLMHIASSLKLNVIAVIGPTNPAYIHPWQTNHRLVTLNLECSPCFFYSPKPLICYRDDVLFKCIKHIDTDMVFRTAEEFLEKFEAS